ncbi:MAG: flagellar biosynthetic protein FliO [Myxococcota bacterium]
MKTEAVPEPAAGTPDPAQTAETQDAPAPARDSAERPPLSTYDRMLQDNNEPIPEERSLTEQLIRTVFALGIVVGLIYLIFKLGLGRLLQGGGMPGFSSRSSREIRVVERTAIDAKNAVYLLELSAKRRILIGAGERGVNYLCEMDKPAEPEAKSEADATLNEISTETPSGQAFNEVLEGYPKTRKPS